MKWAERKCIKKMWKKQLARKVVVGKERKVKKMLIRKQ